MALPGGRLGTLDRLGEGVPQDYEGAVAWYRQAADRGYAGAQFVLGLMYATGQGVPFDDEQSVAWYRKAAEQGHAGAQFFLGFMYFKGEGVPQDDVRAYAWLSAADIQGYVGVNEVKDLIGNAPHETADQRQRDLDFLYDFLYEGEGMPQDYIRAYAWWNIAAAQGGSECARKWRDRIGGHMTRTQIAEARRLSADLVPE